MSQEDNPKSAASVAATKARGAEEWELAGEVFSIIREKRTHQTVACNVPVDTGRLIVAAHNSATAKEEDSDKARLTPHECARQFRMYARSNRDKPDAVHQLNFCADFLDEFCSATAKLPESVTFGKWYRDYGIALGIGEANCREVFDAARAT